MYHHRMLHLETSQAKPMKEEVKQDLHDAASQSSEIKGTIDAHQGNRKANLYKVIPVKIKNAHGKFIDTFAFMDPGSDGTLMDRSLFEVLGLAGTSISLTLGWRGGVKQVGTGAIETSIELAASSDSNSHRLNGVCVVAHLGLPQQSLDSAVMKDTYPYLSDIPLSSYENVTTMLLIGLPTYIAL